MNRATFTIGGMHCDGCAHRIKTLLEKEPGVRDAQVSFSSGLAEVGYNPHVMTESKLVEIIDGAGFAVQAK